MGSHRVDIAGITAFATQLLEKFGFESEASEAVAKSMVRTDVRGVHTHGLYYLARYEPGLSHGSIDAKAHPEIVGETQGTAVIDGNRGLGHLNALFACDVAARKAKEVGCSTVLVRNSSHFGASGIYALNLADRGLIGVVASNAPPLLAPPGGAGRAVSNAPTAYAVPDPDGLGPIVLDIAFSEAAGTKVLQARDRNEEIPEGWLVDSEGRPSRDPSDLMDGAMVPIGGHKGYGLAILVEIMTGILGGGAIGNEVASYARNPELDANTSHWVSAFDIEAFMSLEDFRERMGRFRSQVRGIPIAVGGDQAILPGEPEFRHEQESIENGLLLDVPVWESLIEMADKYDLSDSLWSTIRDDGLEP